jgi:hypothetical protein
LPSASRAAAIFSADSMPSMSQPATSETTTALARTAGRRGMAGGGSPPFFSAGRAIEDCFAIYKKADRAAVFAGWRDMNDYMRENKIEPVPPQLAAQAAQVTKGAAAETR